jgi:hypothetical protein
MTCDEIYLLEDGVEVGLAIQHIEIETSCNVLGHQPGISDKEREEVVKERRGDDGRATHSGIRTLSGKQVSRLSPVQSIPCNSKPT